MINVKLKVDFNNPFMGSPKYAHINDAGVDLQANLTKPLGIVYGQTVLVKTGLYTTLPESGSDDWNWELQIRPRSGLAHKHGITVLNSPGTIDQGYRGEIGVLLHNTNKDIYQVSPGERIAQGVLTKAYKIHWEPVNSLDDTDRGSSGYGDSGK